MTLADRYGSHMTWRVETEDGTRWADATGAGDPETVDEINHIRGLPVERGALGGIYHPTGNSDQVWLFLAATYAIPGPHTIIGNPPRVPPALKSTPEGAVF